MGSSEDFLQKKIIIIGAGVSGLICASRLKDYGFENVSILEARSRIGGRTHTVFYKTDPTCDEENDFVEYGAQWIHGQRHNMVYELAHAEGLINESAPSYMEALANFNLFYTEEESQAIIALQEYFEEKIKEIPDDIKDINFSDFISEAFTNFMDSMSYNDLKMMELLKNVYNWYRKIQCELNGSNDLSLLSTRLLNQFRECEGNHATELKRGFGSIVKLISAKIPNEVIYKNNIVEKIDWSDFKSKSSDDKKKNLKTASICKENTDLKTKVFCNNGAIYEADHVVVTIPLGSLKKHIGSLFYPALSESKIKAIQSVGFGTINKIFLEFKDPFWEPAAIYNVIWDKSLDDIVPDNKSSKAWLKDVNRFAYTPSHRNMLCVWVVCEGAIAMESLEIDEVSCHCMDLLEAVIGKKLPKPQRVLRSKWNSDPYSYGAYSFLSMDSDCESNLLIAKPEVSDTFCVQHPVLQFAGEATHPFHFSTVHGAYESGLREAERLIDHYRYSQI